jgi:crossover junction endodeoxyribonuclease RuvC
MRVIGVDPGLARAGYGVVEQRAGRLVALEHGTLRAEGGAAPEQLASLRARLVAVIRAARPAAMAVERLFYNRNARTAVRVGQACGVVLCAAAEEGLPVFEYGPLQVKQAVVGVGNATKAQVGFMVQRVLSLREEPDSADAADALALAICLLHSERWAARATAGGVV